MEVLQIILSGRLLLNAAPLPGTASLLPPYQNFYTVRITKIRRKVKFYSTFRRMLLYFAFVLMRLLFFGGQSDLAAQIHSHQPEQYHAN